MKIYFNDQKKGAEAPDFHKLICASTSWTFISRVRFISSITEVMTVEFEVLNSFPAPSFNRMVELSESAPIWKVCNFLLESESVLQRSIISERSSTFWIFSSSVSFLTSTVSYLTIVITAGAETSATTSGTTTNFSATFDLLILFMPLS